MFPGYGHNRSRQIASCNSLPVPGLVEHRYPLCPPPAPRPTKRQLQWDALFRGGMVLETPELSYVGARMKRRRFCVATVRRDARTGTVIVTAAGDMPLNPRASPCSKPLARRPSCQGSSERFTYPRLDSSSVAYSVDISSVLLAYDADDLLRLPCLRPGGVCC